VKLFNLFRREKEGYPITISVDGECYSFPVQYLLKGADIRLYACVPDDRDIFIESPGLEQDVKVKDTDDVKLYDGMIFFSTPRYINNG
jgi:hypothetical protein